MELHDPIRRGLGQDPNGGILTTIRERNCCPRMVRARIRSGSEGYLYLGELYADTSWREKALEHLDFAIAEFHYMKMKPSLQRALRHKGILKAQLCLKGFEPS